MTEKIVFLLTSQPGPGEAPDFFFNRIYAELKNPDYISLAGLEINRNVSRFWAASFLNQNWGSGYITNNRLSVQSFSQGVKNIIADDFGTIQNSGGAYAEASNIIINAFEYEKNRNAEIAAAEQAERDRIARLAYEEQQAALAAAAQAERLKIEREAQAAAQAQAEAERIAIEKAIAERNLQAQDQSTINVYDILSQAAGTVKNDADIILQAKKDVSSTTGIPVNEIPVTIQGTDIVTSDSVMAILTQGSGKTIPADSGSPQVESPEYKEKNSADYTPILIGAGLWILKKFF